MSSSRVRLNSICRACTARDRLVGERAALINQLRAFLLERGIIVPKGRHKLELRLKEMLAAEQPSVSSRVRLLIEDMQDQWRELDRRILAFNDESVAQAHSDEAARLLMTIPGIGPLNATALVTAVGKAETFGSGRDLAAWLGVVPKQTTTGGKPKLLGISKRGNCYLRKMLVHGARAAHRMMSKIDTALGQWLRGLLQRAHKNTVVVALAAKLARVACAVLRSGRGFEAAAAAMA